MTELLPILLEMQEHAGPSRIKELAESIPLNHFMMHNSKPQRIRELLLTEAIESSSLVIAEVHKTLIEGAQPAVCFRNAMNIVPMKRNTMRVLYGASGSYLPVVAEGAKYTRNNENPTPVTFTAKKRGEIADISQELVDDAQFDVIEMEVRRAGYNAENTLNQVALSTILENSGVEHDTAGSNQGIKAVASTRGKIRGGAGGGFRPTDLIMNPEAETAVLLDYLPIAAYQKVDNTFVTGDVGPIMRMNAHVCDVLVDAGIGSTYTWGYAADGEIGMLVIDRDRAGAIGMREDITMEDYKEPIRDLVGMKVRMRFDVQKIHANAAARCEY
jgi:hypothetical protein